MARPTATKRRTIGDNPLDALLPPPPTKEAAPGAAGTAESTAPPSRRGRVSKVRATFHLPTDLVNEIKDVVVALSGPPLRLTLASLAEGALRSEIERLKREHNKGRPFPRRDGELRGGRPIGS